ncbi:hypothetical protein [Dysgonomonas sp. 25]|uniref:hypothetical protein n=1 Tax=Dysgonomonas sp. 25 TaxID=2302933 RepID=UPI0013CF9189|nr:hypothetical protein [Dysgonomonas sp. 25]NDV70006.1 hypothetical protein [Dysgonomonas sp. 25]
MKAPHPKYRVKKTDTITVITELFGIAEEIWKRYHNNMCRLDDVIKDNLPEYLEEIYLLPELWDRVKELNVVEESISKVVAISQQVSFGYGNTLLMKFYPETFAYKVTLLLINGPKENKIEYHVSIKWIEKQEDVFLLEINKLYETYKINKQKPDLVADELAIKVASVLYPLELAVTRKDGIIDINNVEEIQKRWDKTKEEILNYNEGEIVEKYISLNEKVLKDEDALLNSLRNDWFLHAYFNDIYQTYTSGYSINNIINVPFILDTEGIEYSVQQTIHKDLDRNGHINIIIKGEVSDTRSIDDLENKLEYNRYPSESPLKGEYDALYIIEPEFNTIEEIKLNTKLDLEYQKIIDIHIVKIKK